MPRSKPRLFAFPREVELAWLRPGTDGETVRLATRAVDAFAEIARQKSVSGDRLAPLVDAARHPDPQVRGLALTRLSVLCHYFPEAIETYGGLIRDADPEVRRFAVTVLANTPSQAIGALLPLALADGDWNVRKAAATVAGALPLPELKPLFAQHLEDERDARVKVVLQLAVAHQDRVGP